MSNKNILELPDKQLKELFLNTHPVSKKINPTGVKTLIDEKLINQALQDYKALYYIPYQALSITPSEDYKYLQNNAEKLIIDEIKEFRFYVEFKEEIREAYEELKDWNKVISSVVYTDDQQSLEAFIDVLEEMYNTTIDTPAKLKKVTGCNDYVKDSEYQLIDILNKAFYSRYFRALNIVLNNGGTYKDLLKIEPKKYGLPETWEGCLSKDKATTISWALAFHFYLGEIAPAHSFPNLRYFAKDIEAPLSVIMDAYSIINGLDK